MGDDPTKWLYKAEKYFTLNRTPDTQKLVIVAMHLDDLANSWFQWLELNQQYGPFIFVDSIADLTHIVQIGSVDEYILQFQALSCKVPGMLDQYLKSYFVAGLKPDI